MSAAEISVDIFELGKHQLNLNEYFTLLRFKHDMEEDWFPFEPDERYYPRLIADGFIEVVSSEVIADGTTKYVCKLGPSGIKVFEGEEDLFEEFYTTFPHKVPTGMGFRPVSTTDVNSVSAKATRAIWNRIVKNKPHLQRIIIDNLKKELAHRQKDGSLAYLHGIDTWLRQATWEKWEDIPDSKKTSGGYKQL